VTLQVSGVGFAYDAGTPVLRGVSLAAEPGELVAVVGPNGCGKSTLLDLCCGIRAPSAGTVTIGGEALASLPARARARRVALVPQAPRVAFGFSALEVVLMGRGALDGGFLDGADAVSAARAALAEVDAEALAERRLDTLSGGERQRVFIAQALAQSADVLLLDEPTNHLDPAHQLAVWAHVRDHVRRDGRACVAVAHDVNLAVQFADRLVVLAAGVVRAEGTPDAILASGALQSVFAVDLHVGRHPELDVPFLAPLRRGT
jgi:iron complex transport system ATP-binding protein